MLIETFFSGAIELILNNLLISEKSRKEYQAYQRLIGQVLKITLIDRNYSFFILFNETHIDVQNSWEGEVNCVIKIAMSSLPRLIQKESIVNLLKSDTLIVEGDLSVIQRLNAVLENEYWDPFDKLTPYIGDFATEGVYRLLKMGSQFFKNNYFRQKEIATEALIEEWQIIPHQQIVTQVKQEIELLSAHVEQLSIRVEKIEAQS